MSTSTTSRRLFRRTDHDREIVRLAVPALGQLGAEPLYVIVDTAVVGHLGTEELGGLAIAGTLLTTAFWLFNFLGYGTTSVVARLFGAGDRDAATHRAVQAMWLAVLIGIGLIVVGLALGPAGVSLLGASDNVRPFALTYLRISLLGIPAILIALVGMGYYRGLHDMVTPLWIAVVANVANLVIELVLIFGFDWGIEGSAWATVIAQWGAALWFLRRVGVDVAAYGVPTAPEMPHLRQLARIGRDLVTRTGTLLLAIGIATAVAARLGDIDLGAHQVAFQIWIFLALVLDALAIAGQAMIGRFLGADDSASARRASVRMLEWGVVVGLAFTLLVLALRPVLPGVFSDDPAVRDLLEDLLVIVALLQPLNAAVFVLDGILIGAGDFRYLAVAMTVSTILFAPLAFGVLSLDLSLTWLWGALGIFMAARLVANATRFDGESWMVVGAERT